MDRFLHPSRSRCLSDEARRHQLIFSTGATKEKKEIAFLRAQLAAREEQIKARDETIEALNKKLEVKKEENEDHAQQIMVKTEKVEDLGTENTTLWKKRSELRRSLEEEKRVRLVLAAELKKANSQHRDELANLKTHPAGLTGLQDKRAFPPEQALHLCFSSCSEEQEATDSYFLSPVQTLLLKCFHSGGTMTIQDFFAALQRDVRGFKASKHQTVQMSSNLDLAQDPSAKFPLRSHTGVTRVVMIFPHYIDDDGDMEFPFADLAASTFASFCTEALDVAREHITFLGDAEEGCDGPATEEGIKSGIRKVMKDSKSGDSVIVVLSSHSFTGEGHGIWPTDAKEIVGADKNDELPQYDGIIARSVFRKWMKPKAGVHVLSFLDLCRAGNVLNYKFTQSAGVQSDAPSSGNEDSIEIGGAVAVDNELDDDAPVLPEVEAEDSSDDELDDVPVLQRKESSSRGKRDRSVEPVQRNQDGDPHARCRLCGKDHRRKARTST